MSQQHIIQTIKEHEDYLRSLGVSKVGLFGSQARGDNTKDSDVDVIIDFLPGKKNFKSYMNSVFFLEKILGTRVDPITPVSLNSILGKYISEDLHYVEIN